MKPYILLVDNYRAEDWRSEIFKMTFLHVVLIGKSVLLVNRLYDRPSEPSFLQALWLSNFTDS